MVCSYILYKLFREMAIIKKFLLLCNYGQLRVLLTGEEGATEQRNQGRCGYIIEKIVVQDTFQISEFLRVL